VKEHRQPWVSGPGEILRHGLELLRKDSDTNRRLAMISIDNSVELMVKTYLGLPKRITGLSITRKEFAKRHYYYCYQRDEKRQFHAEHAFCRN
jgi:hypothetical protein